jgi:solute carrier family 29 (equilibrative nucleoside transporter) protein 4
LYLTTDGVRRRWGVAKGVWPYMMSIGMAYFVTLCLFPGIESEVVSCHWYSWMPILLISVFNFSDFGGKVRIRVTTTIFQSQRVLIVLELSLEWMSFRC